MKKVLTPAAAYYRKRKDRAIKANLCMRCFEAPPDDGLFCACCRKKQKQLCDANKDRYSLTYKASYKRRRARLKDAGICMTCGKKKPAAGDEFCAPCRLRKQQNELACQNRKRDARRDAGLCIHCGEVPPPGYKQCTHHMKRKYPTKS